MTGLWQLSSGFLAAHIAYECAEVAAGDRSGFPPWWFSAGASLAAVAAFLRTLWAHRSEWTGFLTVAFPFLQILCVFLAAVFEVLDVFTLAYASTTVIVVWIYALANVGLVRYDWRYHHFLLTRSTLYAALRATTHLWVRHGGLPCRLGRFVPFLFGSLETVGMWWVGSAAYAFTVHSDTFGEYVALKSVVLVCLPLLEDAALRTCSA